MMVTRSAAGSVPGIGGFTRLQLRLPPLLRTFIIKPYKGWFERFAERKK